MTQELSSKKSGKYFYAVGKRKTAVATVRLYTHENQTTDPDITVNDRTLKDYFPVKSYVNSLTAPLKLTDTKSKFNITVRVKGGGVNAQADAVRHGISRALLEYNQLLRPTLKKAGYLTRDSRMKERKKYGLKRARRGQQFSKR